MVTKFICVIAVVFALVGCSSSNEPSSTDSAQTTFSSEPKEVPTSEPAEDLGVSSTGTWSFAEDTLVIEAEIVNDSVLVTFGAEGGSRFRYWAGSFNDTTLNDGDKIVSKADLSARNKWAIVSDAKTLEFVYDDGKLVFDFAMMGRSRPVPLEK